MKLNRILFGLLLLLAAQQGLAQEPLFFRQINTNNGLSHNKVNCILEDRRGFLWIGTDDGLNRFDGSNFTVFRHQPGNATSIGGNTVTSLAEDEQGLLWIATSDGGLSRYDYKAAANVQFINYKHQEGDSNSIPTNSINYIYYQQPGYLWLATGGKGVVRLNTQNGRAQQVVIKRSSTFLTLLSPRPGWLWAGSIGGGIITINTTTMAASFDERYSNPYKQLPHVVVSALFKDSKGAVWAGSWDKTVYRFANTAASGEQVVAGNQPLLSQDDAICFTEDNRGRIWVGSRATGLHIYDGGRQTISRYTSNPAQEGTLAGNAVYCLLTDRSGNIWAGTGKGLSLYKPSLQQFAQQFLPVANGAVVNRVYDFYENAGGLLHIGTDRGLFTKPANGAVKLQEFRNVQQPLHITRFFPYKNELLLGTNQTVFRYHAAAGQATPLPDSAQDLVMNRIIESRIVSLAADTLNGRPVIWAVPYGHYLAWYDVTAKRWVSRLDSSRNIIATLNLKDNLVRKLWVDTRGTRWMATTKNGLARMRRNESSFTYFSNSSNAEAGLSAVQVFDVFDGGGDTLWVSTYGDGLYRFDMRTSQFTHIPESPNLCEGLQKDDRGGIWFIANARLWKYEPAVRQLSSWQVPDLEKSGGISGYLFKDAAGWLYAAGSNYFIRFNPAAVFKPEVRPQVYITNLLVNSVAHPDYLFRSGNRFSYRENTISFQFAAPQAPDDAPAAYEYRLGNGPWTAVLTNNTVSFPSLPPGAYKFEVKLAGNGGRSSVARFSFRIIPPFYQTWWFYSICAIVLAGGVWWFYRYRINELVKRQAIRNKIARDLHDNIGSTLGSISVYGRVGAIHNENGNSKELGEILERISHTSSDMINEMNDIVWAINPANDSMEKIVDRMHAFAAPLLRANQIDFSLDAEPAVQKLNLPMEKRNNLYLVFKECLHNAVKYSGGTSIGAKMWVKNGRLHLLFTDNGKGFDITATAKTAKLGGAGLPGMQQRATEMKGQVRVTSAPGKGTEVHLSFPV